MADDWQDHVVRTYPDGSKMCWSGGSGHWPCEVSDLRARLAAVEAERDALIADCTQWKACAEAAEAERDEALADRKLDLQGAAGYFKMHEEIWRKGADNLRARAKAAEARLAEVEAERDALRCKDPDWCGGRCNCATDGALLHRAVRAEARLDAVEALRDWPTENGADSPWVRGYNAALRNVRAAAAREDDGGYLCGLCYGKHNTGQCGDGDRPAAGSCGICHEPVGHWRNCPEHSGEDARPECNCDDVECPDCLELFAGHLSYCRNAAHEACPVWAGRPR